MSEVGKFAEWAIVEIMGHRVFAGFVSEQMIAGRGFIRIDVPEDRTVSYAIVPAYTKVFGTDAVFSLSPCTEETVRRHIAGTGYRMEGAKLLTPPNPVAVPANSFTDEHGLPAWHDSRVNPIPVDPAFAKRFADNPTIMTEVERRLTEESSVPFGKCDHGPYAVCDNCARPDAKPAQADIDEFAKAFGIEPEPSPSEFRIPAHPIEDAGFTDPIDNEPF